jgi:hypothetical protein
VRGGRGQVARPGDADLEALAGQFGLAAALTPAPDN